MNGPIPKSHPKGLPNRATSAIHCLNLGFSLKCEPEESVHIQIILGSDLKVLEESGKEGKSFQNGMLN